MRIRIVEYSDATVHGDMRDPKCAFGAIKMSRCFRNLRLNSEQVCFCLLH